VVQVEPWHARGAWERNALAVDDIAVGLRQEGGVSREHLLAVPSRGGDRAEQHVAALLRVGVTDLET
jgi:hypothetical protein